jgi:hypothetical protein
MGQQHFCNGAFPLCVRNKFRASSFLFRSWCWLLGCWVFSFKLPDRPGRWQSCKDRGRDFDRFPADLRRHHFGGTFKFNKASARAGIGALATLVKLPHPTSVREADCVGVNLNFHRVGVGFWFGVLFCAGGRTRRG